MCTPKKFKVAQGYFQVSRLENNIMQEDYKADFFFFNLAELLGHIMKFLHYSVV